MYIKEPIKLIWLVFMVEVESSQERTCRRKEPQPGVLVLAQGSNVTLSCSGQIIVNGVDVTLATKVWVMNDRGENKETRKIVSSTGRSRGSTTVSAGRGISVTNVEAGLGGTAPDAVTVSPSAVLDGLRHQGPDEVTPEAEGDRVYRLPKGQSKDLNNAFSVNRTNSGFSGTAGQLGRGLRGVHWKWNGHLVKTTGERRVTLHVMSLQVSQCGNYSCYQQGKLSFSVRIIVEAALEQPTLSCYRKSPTSNTRCEWKARAPVSPVPQCHLILRRGVLGQSTIKECSYSKPQARCRCVLDQEPEGTREEYWGSLCVYNNAGSVASPPIKIHPPDLIKPDPPCDVSVRAVDGNEHRLIVTWKYPRSWGGNFYKLTFQLQYFYIVQGEPLGKQEVDTHEVNHSITDAVPNTKYLLQVRAREELGLGHWSDWSPPLYAYTWTGPAPTRDPLPTDTALCWYGCYEDSDVDSDMIRQVSAAATSQCQTLVHMSWVAGTCILLVLAGLSGCALRNRERLMFKLCKMTRSTSSQPSLPLSSSSSCSSPREGNLLVFADILLPQEYGRGEGIHLNNMGYFLLQRD